jgi:hypothetical protein
MRKKPKHVEQSNREYTVLVNTARSGIIEASGE